MTRSNSTNTYSTALLAFVVGVPMIVAAAEGKEIYYSASNPFLQSETTEPATSGDNRIRLFPILGPNLAPASYAGTIRMSEVSIAPTIASPLGYPTFLPDAIDAGRIAIEGAGINPRVRGAAEYR